MNILFRQSPASTPAAQATGATERPTTEAVRPRAEAAEPTLVPAVDVIEDAGGITLYADLPGVPRDQLHLRIDGEQLTIEAEALRPAADWQPLHVERPLARYRRAFTLSQELDATQIGAELAQGVLRVRIPKVAPVQPRRIPVQTA